MKPHKIYALTCEAYPKNDKMHSLVRFTANSGKPSLCCVLPSSEYHGAVWMCKNKNHRHFVEKYYQLKFFFTVMTPLYASHT